LTEIFRNVLFDSIYLFNIEILLFLIEENNNVIQNQ